ncbi:PLP-dependent transferase [Patescibacteria group bacterium]
MSKEKIIKQSIKDLEEDFNELTFLAKDCKKKLKYFKCKDLKNELNTLLKQIESKKSQTKKINTTENIERIETQKLNQFFKLRKLLHQSSQKVTEREWQSPSFSHNKYEFSGLLSGKISHTLNDYKRDQHEIGKKYEKKFINEYFPSGINSKYSALATNSGMSAFTTILSYIIFEEKIEEALIEKGAYFEAKKIVKKAFIKTNSFNILKINSFEIKNNTALFIDSISNDTHYVSINIEKLLKKLSKSKYKIVLVIDNTSASIKKKMHQIKIPKNIALISYESLNKFHQFGLDQTTGGIIVSPKNIFNNLFHLRMNLGTNILDQSAATLPTPSKKMLNKRLNRISRNSNYFVNYINKYSSKKIIDHAMLPKTDKDAQTRNENFSPYVLLSFKKKWDNTKKQNQFVKSMYKKTKKHNLEITGGTSFGLPISRLYLTALRSDISEPFVRFSPGTESLFQIDKVSKLFASNS